MILETERLYIREFQPEDDKGMFEMDADAAVHQYIGRRPIQTIDESRAVIAFIQQQYINDGIGRWAVIEKATGDFIGWTGFKLIREKVNGHIHFYDFGYRFMQRKWRQGYGYESGLAALQHGLAYLPLQDVYAMTDVQNIASRNLLEKLGFRFVELFNYDGEPTWREAGEPTTWYHLSAGRQ